MRIVPGILVVCGLAAGACSVRTPDLPVGCQPLLDGADCLLPWPSDFFRQGDAEKGFVVRTSGAALLRTESGAPADVTAHWSLDGFSRISPILARFDEALSRGELNDVFADPATSIEDSHPTLIINADTLERVPHFVDLDPDADGLLTLYPVVRLAGGSRYVVVIRNVTNEAGEPVRAPEKYARLRDGRGAGDLDLRPLRDRFERDVFDVLQAAGIERASTQLAWSFTTASEGSARSDMLQVREQTRVWLVNNTPEVTILGVDEDPEPGIWRLVHGKITTPLFLDTPTPSGSLVRDPDGRLKRNGTTTFRFVALIPASVRDSGQPGRVLEYGHGFFGSRSEIYEVGGTTGLLTDLGMVTFATDWWGMSEDDVLTLVNRMTTEPGRALDFTDRVHQAMANWMVLNAAIRGPLTDQPELQLSGGTVSYDDTLMSYLGISQGHILGGVLAAVEPDFDRVGLQVGGAAFSHMMVRSRSFAPFLDILESQVPERVDQAKFMAMSQHVMSRIDGVEYADLVLTDPLPGARPRRVLMQIAQGDPLVPFVGSDLHARELGVRLLTPSHRSVYGLQEVTAPYDGSAMEWFDFGIDTSGYEQPRPLDDNDVHDDLRKMQVVSDQLDAFYTPSGAVVHTCSGACDPD